MRLTEDGSLILSWNSVTLVDGPSPMHLWISVRTLTTVNDDSLFFLPEGTSYPNATGNTQPHDEGVEREWLHCFSRDYGFSTFISKETGNMLIMTLAHARASGDGSLIARYVSSMTIDV